MMDPYMFIDFNPFDDMVSILGRLVIFGFCLVAGVLALGLIPGRFFRFLIGFGLIGVGVAVLLGWLVII